MKNSAARGSFASLQPFLFIYDFFLECFWEVLERSTKMREWRKKSLFFVENKIDQKNQDHIYIEFAHFSRDIIYSFTPFLSWFEFSF